MTVISTIRLIFIIWFLCAGIAVGAAACQVFDGETTDTSDYECPSLMPIMTPDGSCTASLDEALAMVESMDDPELLISPGDYTVSRAITRPITFRSSRARAFSRPDVADFEQINSAIVPRIIGHGLGAKAMGLEHEPKVILRAANAETGIIVEMSDDAHRMALIGAELHGKEGGPAFTVRQGKIGIVQSRVFSPIEVTGTKSRLFLDGVRMVGGVPALLEGETIHAEDYWRLYDVVGACDDALLVVDDGAVVNAVGLELADHSPLGLCVDNAQATLYGGSIHDIAYDDECRLGRGVHVIDGGKLTLRSVDLYAVHEAGIWAKGAGTELTIEQDTAVTDVDPAYSTDLQMNAGIVMDDGATLSLQGATISDIEGVGIWLTGGAGATIDDLVIESTDAAGIAVFDAALTLSSSTISGTEASIDAGGGYGISVDATALGPATVEVTDTTISDSAHSGILINGDGSSVGITGVSISNSIGSNSSFHEDGFGILAADVCSGLTLEGITLGSNTTAHIFLDGSNATMGSIAFGTTGCADADFVQQVCSNSCVTIFGAGDLNTAGIVEPPNTIELFSECPYLASHVSLMINLGIAGVIEGR